MNFFESQDRVRKHTARLVFLFALAVISLIIMTNFLVMMAFGFLNVEQTAGGGSSLQGIDWQTFALVGIAVGLVVLVGSLFKIMALSSGGKTVAESLDGKLVPTNTDDLQLRKLLNVVEEMAIASGISTPPVYVLDKEPGINAFAAGFALEDAVIGVTRGTIERLSREELQGVIAHEFSHVFNGDMRLNIRLIGVLNGILILGIAGRFILRSASFSRRGRGNGAAGILALAVGLMAIGFAGTFFGGLIKAAVSRQREYLADASAVQFTRNPDSIAGALKRIGGLQYGSKVENPGAAEISHAFFAESASGFMQSLASTHPPLEQRILRIDPQWDGKFNTSDTAEVAQDTEASDKQTAPSPEQVVTAVVGAAAAAGAAMPEFAAAIEEIGNPKSETVEGARALIDELPIAIKEAAHDPYGARALIYSMVFDSEQVIRGRQWALLDKFAEPDVLALSRKLQAQIQNLDIRFRLPTIDMAIPALKQLSLDQYKIFKQNLVALIEMDGRVDLLEWLLQKNLFGYLDAHFYGPAPAIKSRHRHASQLSGEIQLMLSVIARAGHQNEADAEAAFNSATSLLEFNELQLLDKDKVNLIKLDIALQKLLLLKPLDKPKLLEACAACVVYDKMILPAEYELLRAFSRALNCPMPLLSI